MSEFASHTHNAATAHNNSSASSKELTPTEGRQGETGHHVRYILMVGTAIAALALFGSYFAFMV